MVLMAIAFLTCFSSCRAQILYEFESTSYSVLEGDQIVITVQRSSTDVAVRSVIVILQVCINLLQRLFIISMIAP